jgi:hypothetical protein
MPSCTGNCANSDTAHGVAFVIVTLRHGPTDSAERSREGGYLINDFVVWLPPPRPTCLFGLW